MKRRLGFLSWIVTAAVLVGAIYAGAAVLNFLWYGPGYSGALAGRHSPEMVHAASRVYVYDQVIVTEGDRVVFRSSRWASARFAAILGAAAAIAAVALRRRRFVWIAALVVAGTTFAISRAHASDVVVRRGPGKEVVVRGEDVALVVGKHDVVLVRTPDAREASLWRRLVARKLAPRP